MQRWALGYALYLEKRLAAEDAAVVVEQLTMNLDPHRWREVYRPDLVDGETEEVGVDNPDEVDDYFDKVARGEVFSMSGAEAVDGGWV